MTTIYQRLKNDHDKHRDLLEKIVDTSGDSDERRKHWKTFYEDVSAHAAAEEEVFYAPLMAKEDGQPLSRHGVAEHKELDDIMLELEEMDFSSPGWLARFKTLKHKYEHHMEEEENDIFPDAKDIVSKDAALKMADKFDERKKQERALVDQKAEDAMHH
jgi:hemerythrin superfamily protein